MREYYKDFDETSFNLGVIDCFCEMVAAGVKGLALSHPMTEEEYKWIGGLSDRIAGKYSVKSFLEKNLIETDLSPADLMENRWVILYYKDSGVLEDYFALKSRAEGLRKEGHYGESKRREITESFRRLLGYPAK